MAAIQLKRGRYAARFAAQEADVAAAQALRARCFLADADERLDQDVFDAKCAHVLVEEVDSGALVACFRLLPLRNGAAIEESYSAQFYDLKQLSDFSAPMVEMGRFCIAPQRHDPDILRVAWGFLAAFVDGNEIEMIFGCSSFAGLQAERYRETFSLLAAAHQAPCDLGPGVKAPEVVRFERPSKEAMDRRAALAAMPPLLRSYLSMGGWVSDHAVVDRFLKTLHVFTGLSVAAIPAGRARALRALQAVVG